MSLEDWLATESKMERFTVQCGKLRRVDTLQRRKSDNAVVAKSRFAGEAAFIKSWSDDSVVKEDIGAELTSVKLSVDIHFLPSFSMVEHKSFGMLSFYKAMSTDDGIVNDPDKLILTLFLPDDLLTRIERTGSGMRIGIRVGDLVEVHSGAMPGLSKKVWKNADAKYLHVRECTVIDPEANGDVEDAGSNHEEPRIDPPATVHLDPVFQQRLIFGGGLILALLILLVLK